MNMKKQFQGTLLCLTLSAGLALTGCGNNKVEETPDPVPYISTTGHIEDADGNIIDSVVESNGTQDTSDSSSATSNPVEGGDNAGAGNSDSSSAAANPVEGGDNAGAGTLETGNSQEHVTKYQVPDGLQGYMTKDGYYNEYFNVALTLSEEWTGKQNDDFLQWIVGDITSYSAFTGINITDMSSLCCSLIKPGEGITTDAMYQNYVTQLPMYYEMNGYTITANEDLLLHIGDAEYPLNKLVISQDGQEVYNLMALVSNGDYVMQILITAPSEQEALNITEIISACK